MREKVVFFVGQRVLVTTTHREEISEIEKITPTGLICVRGRKCKYKPDGRYYKDYWNNSFIQPLTKKQEQSVIADKMADKLACVDFKRLDYKTLEKLYKIVTKKTEVPNG